MFLTIYSIGITVYINANLFYSGFLPVAVNFLRRVPVIGTLLSLPGISSVSCNAWWNRQLDVFFSTCTSVSLNVKGILGMWSGRVYLHVPLKSPFSWLFKNGLNEFTWSCSHILLKYIEKIKGATDKNSDFNGTCERGRQIFGDCDRIHTTRIFCLSSLWFQKITPGFPKNNGELCCVVDDIPNTHWEYRPSVLENHPPRY